MTRNILGQFFNVQDLISLHNVFIYKNTMNKECAENKGNICIWSKGKGNVVISQWRLHRSPILLICIVLSFIEYPLKSKRLPNNITLGKSDMWRRCIRDLTQAVQAFFKLQCQVLSNYGPQCCIILVASLFENKFLHAAMGRA